MQVEERRRLLQQVLQIALTSPHKGWYLVLEVPGLPGANVVLSRPAKGLRLVVGEGWRGEPRRPVLQSAVTWLTQSGFEGGGNKGNYRTWKLPADLAQVAELMDEAIDRGFAPPQGYDLQLRTSVPELTDQSPAHRAVLPAKLPAAINEASGADPILPLLQEIVAAAGGSLKVFPGQRSDDRIIILSEQTDGARGLTTVVTIAIDSAGAFRWRVVDSGPFVSRTLGGAITAYEWVRTVPTENISTFVSLLGGHSDEDLLELVKRRYDAGVDVEMILKNPAVCAEFASWHGSS
jgi:hypothetical protein